MHKHYAVFSWFIARNTGADSLATIHHVMAATGGSADPNMVAEWWQQWADLRTNLRHIGMLDAGYNLVPNALEKGKLP